MSEYSEQTDLVRSLAGDGEAYARIVARHQAQVARRMRSFTNRPADIEELVQEVFVDAYRSLGRYRGEGPFAAWLASIATRVGYRYWKRRRRRPEVGCDDNWWRQLPQQESPHEIDALDPDAAARLVHGLLERLPPRDRLVLLLLYVEGHSLERAAQLAGWSKTMTKVQAFRARRKLRTLLAELGIDSARAASESLEDALHE